MEKGLSKNRGFFFSFIITFDFESTAKNPSNKVRIAGIRDNSLLDESAVINQTN
jgi:hypothetical protein